jgi:hypothetical protein
MAHMEIKWDDTDPETGKRRFVKAERFAGRWAFFCRKERRGVWEKWAEPTREMWQDLLEALERRLARREAIELGDVEMVRRILAEWRDAPSV